MINDREFFSITPIDVIRRIVELSNEQWFQTLSITDDFQKSSYDDISPCEEAIISNLTEDRNGVEEWDLLRKSDISEMATLYALTEMKSI